MEKQKEVKLYSTPSCPFSKQTREYLDDNNIDYVEYDVSNDQQMREDLFERTSQMVVPVIDIEGSETIIGWQENEIAEALGINQ